MRYTCRECDELFATRHELDTHLVMHLLERLVESMENIETSLRLMAEHGS